MKTCSKCGAEKEYNCFKRHSGRKDGYDARCKYCIKEERALEYARDPAKFRESANRRNRVYAAKNRQKLRKKNAAWAKANPSKVAAKGKRHRAISNGKYAARYKKYCQTNIARNRESSKRSMQKTREVLGDAYVKRLAIRQGFRPETIDGDPEVLGVVRTIIKIKRICKKEKSL